MGSRSSVAIPVALGLLAALGACGGPAVPRFPLRDPMTVDPDLGDVDYPCRPDPKKPGKRICAPEEFTSYLYWDLADKSVFRPTSRFFAVRPGGESVDVNSMDEVPDSSWFTNRVGVRDLTNEEREGGFCASQKKLPARAEPGTWLVDQGKADGVTPGFRVKVPEAGKFMFKADRLATPLRASTAEAVGARLYWAAGFGAPCNFVTVLDPKALRLEPGLVATNDLGQKVPFDAKSLADVLAQAAPEPGGVRMGVSQWLPGRPLGPFTYDGVWDADPRDVVPHEDRRELRAARLMAAWISHYDAREQNTMATWMAKDPDAPDSAPGHVVHWYLDFGDSLGTKTKIDDLSRRYGRAYLFDPGEVLTDFATFGAIVRPWETVTWPNGIFPYFTDEGFVAEDWKPGYPNPAFSRMTEHDGAWMARIIAWMDERIVKPAVDAGKLPPNDAAFLFRTLMGRRAAILRRYLAKLSPIGNLRVAGRAICGVDLARRAGVFDDGRFRYGAWIGEGEAEPRTPVAVGPDGTERGRICVSVDATLARTDAAAGGRRFRLRIANGQAPGSLDVYLVDEGPAGLRILGARRPVP